MLRSTDTLELTIYHDAQPITQGFALFHAKIELDVVLSPNMLTAKI